MQNKNGQLLFSPSDLTTFMDSQFDSWMDRYNLEFPGEFEPGEVDPSTRLLQKHGNAHEARFLQGLKDKGSDVVEITGSGESAEQATIGAMRDGRDVIFQAVLSGSGFAGRADFLCKVGGASDLGDYHYEAWDTKLAKKAKPYFVVQLCCYSEMIGHIQGRLPQRFKVVLGDLTEKEFRTNDFISYYRQLKDSLLAFQKKFSKEAPPESCIAGSFSLWKSVSEQMLEERDDLSRVANIRKVHIQRLKKVGITTMRQLAETVESIVPKMNVDVLDTLRRQAQVQLETGSSGKTSFAPLPPMRGKGLSLLPPASNHDVFFDMEGYPHIDEGLEYLFGVVVRTKSGMEFKDWWAHNREDEQKAFEQFIDWIYSRWLGDPSMHIYHYAAYEVSAMRMLAGRYNTRIDEVDNLLRNEVFVDLYMIVRQSLLVGEPSYSLKKVEHLYGKQRQGDVATAMESVVFYEVWLETKDGDTWQDSQILKEIRDYNEQDCVSTLELADWLRERQKELGMSYTGKIAEVPASTDIVSAAALLAAQLIENADRIDDPEKKRIQRLLAYFLEFHKREDKPSWWRIFDRQKMTDLELFEDLDCLAGMKRTKRQPFAVRRSTAYEYEFLPDQDTKIDEGDRCMFVHDLTEVGVELLDRENGLVVLVVGPGKSVPPAEVSIMLCDIISTKTISDSIYRIVLNWSASGSLPSALSDLLHRREPRIKGLAVGEPVSASADINEVKEAISRMDGTIVCVQGPPGSGKTYTAAQTIIELLRKKKCVGVTSNSHKAIENLLDEIVKVSTAQRVLLRAVKVGGQEYVREYVEYVEDGGTLFKQMDLCRYNLVAGTAWLFSNEDAQGLFDYLFIDEAGQVCLANVVGMSRSSKNLVLLGDQMQLEQPTQGAHPEDSGTSCLEYYLQEHATIPPNLGIFLSTSWRMHPDLCSVISESVYEGRLTAEADTANQQVVPPKELFGQFKKRAGIVWVPVWHEGNTQGSEEEADVIKQIVSDLVTCKFADKSGVEHNIGLKDILIVAPYNMQVRMIASRIKDACVASVDKFQGRQAPIVILSMCSSDGSSSARGINFLFSKNRLNVALSRAKALAIVVGHPNLVNTACSSLDQIRLLNFFDKIVEVGKDVDMSVLASSS